MSLSKRALALIAETCPACTQIKEVTEKIKKKHPSLHELDIVSAVASALGDGPLMGTTDEDLMEWAEETYLKKGE